MRLADGEVHVHYRLFDAVSEGAYQTAWATLDREERQRAARFVLAGSRETFVLAHGLLRQTLSLYGDAAPGDWTFVTNEFGKPALADSAGGLAFNLAHTDGLVACAIARDDVGVDVEAIDRRVDALAIASRFFSPEETAWLEAASPDARPVRFLELWTLKEAYVKGLGRGLSHPLDAFRFTFGAAGSLRFDVPGGGGSDPWQFALYAPSARHRLAVAARRRASAPSQPVVSLFTDGHVPPPRQLAQGRSGD